MTIDDVFDAPRRRVQRHRPPKPRQSQSWQVVQPARFAAFLRGYVECALFTETIEYKTKSRALHTWWRQSDLPDAVTRAIAADCRWFLAQPGVLGALDLAVAKYTAWEWHFAFTASSPDYPVEEMAGHDFWLTRQDHGAGFWDGDWPDGVGDALNQAAQRCGEATWDYDPGSHQLSYRGDIAGADPPASS